MRNEKQLRMNRIELIWNEYKTEFLFALGLIICVILSYGLAPFIPVSFYDTALRPILNGCIATVSLFGAILLFRHNQGVNVRILWACILLVWTALATVLFMRVFVYNEPIDSMATISLRGRELVLGNVYAWLLLHYPTAVLRPGWLNPKRALINLVPVAVVAVMDELLPVDLKWFLIFYPVVLGVLLLYYHGRAYKKWCEENYSSMDNIDVQWIWRYMTMYFVVGACYVYMCLDYSVAHGFTMQWLLLFLLCYSTEQILYRQDPWNMLRKAKHGKGVAIAIETKNWTDEIEVKDEDDAVVPELSNAEYRAQLEQWMESEKPYLNPEFRLTDLRQILPLNRTYLSQLIHTEYDCNFYQFVTKYRIEEAKRLMTEHPDMKMQDVAEQCGFSSAVVFSRIFTRETGTSPSDWSSL